MWGCSFIADAVLPALAGMSHPTPPGATTIGGVLPALAGMSPTSKEMAE